MSEKLLAHNIGRPQTIEEHLNNVSSIAGDFASSFHASDMARFAGAYHDIGKYSSEFQNYLHCGGAKVDHSTAGMKEILNLHNTALVPAAFCVAGHHSGLPNGGFKNDSSDSGTLFGRFKKEVCDYSSFRDEFTLPETPLANSFSSKFDAMFFTRLIFSCLVDADYLDTESTVKDGVERGGFSSIKELSVKLDSYIKEYFSNPVREIDKYRTQILHHCIDMGDSNDNNLLRLTVPTGGGKTISSLAFALHRAVKQKKDRVIYVIPYTSIIEQTADVFRKILGDENVVECHSQKELDSERLRLASENWDAPVIVTTNVQFFESLFANKPSRCRKLHNIVNSVIVFDEAQMIPIDLLKPCVFAIENLVSQYGCAALLCSATQPALDRFFKNKEIKEICPLSDSDYAFFKRTNIKFLSKPLSVDDLVVRLSSEKQVLCILNTKNAARAVYQKLDKDGTFFLTTDLYPEHRRRVLRQIQDALNNHRPCRVVSTSLIEAGVDLDFPCVFRELAGLDSINQAAGRENREGKNPLSESFTYVFQLAGVPKNPAIEKYAAVSKIVCEKFEDISSLEAIRAYFDMLYSVKGEALDKERILSCIESENFPFADVAEKFRIIKSDSVPVLIPMEDEACRIRQELCENYATKKLLRRASQYCVDCRGSDIERLERDGVVCKISEDTKFYILLDVSRYSESLGFQPV